MAVDVKLPIGAGRLAARAAMQALSSLWGTEARPDGNNMAPKDALRFWASAGIRMPWIEPLTWAYVALSVFVYSFLCTAHRQPCCRCF